MVLGELVPDGGGSPVAEIAYDSRRVTPGTAFFCITGLVQDGHDHAPEAVARGATGLVVERPLGLGVPEVVVPSARASLALAAARFFGHPSRELEVVGVTGTNGKSTSAFLLRAVLEAAGGTCGLLGTVKAVVAGDERSVTLTTPESSDLQRALRGMVDGGDRACVMEVSSHGLAFGRCDHVEFAAAIFTNLTRDHLDFHRTMDAYFRAKRRLFVGEPDVAVINVDDPYGRALAEEYPDAVTVAIGRPADYRARYVTSSFAGSRFTVRAGHESLRISSPLPGEFNVRNMVGVCAAARALGVRAGLIAETLAAERGPPGRFQLVDEGQPFAAVVDFAHTPDALTNALGTAREVARGRVICVFGCAGERDPGTRRPMGAAASALADSVIVTSDSPKSEDPEQIIAEVLRGAGPAAEAFADRGEAIARALELAEPQDIVVIAGRGDETRQTFANGRLVEFDDVAFTRALLNRAEEARPGPV